MQPQQQPKKQELTPDLARRILIDAHQYAAYKGAFSRYQDAEIEALIKSCDLLKESVAMKLEPASQAGSQPGAEATG